MSAGAVLTSRNRHHHRGRGAEQCPGLLVHADERGHLSKVLVRSHLFDDDSDATLPNTVTYVAPGTWTLTEQINRDSWSMTNLTCNGRDLRGLADRRRPLTVLSGKTITCTYTNNFIYKNLEVTKTAVASYDRATWDAIAKSVDKTTVNMTSGAATFNYVVTATPDGARLELQVSGTIG